MTNKDFTMSIVDGSGDMFKKNAGDFSVIAENSVEQKKIALKFISLREEDKREIVSCLPELAKNKLFTLVNELEALGISQLISEQVLADLEPVDSSNGSNYGKWEELCKRLENRINLGEPVPAKLYNLISKIPS